MSTNQQFVDKLKSCDTMKQFNSKVPLSLDDSLFKAPQEPLTPSGVQEAPHVEQSEHDHDNEEFVGKLQRNDTMKVFKKSSISKPAGASMFSAPRDLGEVDMGEEEEEEEEESK
jgi:hypothetical protein